ARDRVVAAQRRADAGGDRLLADVLVRHARDLVRVHELDDALLEAADRPHRAVELEPAPAHSREPPFTPRRCPATTVERSLSRKTTAFEISVGVPSRPKSVRAPTSSFCCGVAAPSAGVSVGPGETAFTRTPNGLTSRASDFVSAITPPFAAA